MPDQVYLSLGSNLGNRRMNLSSAVAAIEERHIRVTARSPLYETEPQEVTDQPCFINMVIECETELTPHQLLNTLLEIERKLGRVRSNVERRGPRLIDIDIVLFGDRILATDELTIPHPRLLDRRFVLEPLLEVAPGLRYPGIGAALETFREKSAGQAVTRLRA